MTSDNLLRTLRRLESELHKAETRCNVTRLLELLHPDFEEFGRSGRRYSRAEIVSELLSENDVPRVSARDFAVARLGEGVVLLTYKSSRVNASGAFDRHTLRSSLWMLTAAGWQMRFHQGTPTDDVGELGPQLSLTKGGAMKFAISIAALTLVALCEIPRVSAEANLDSDTYLETCPITHANGSTPPGERHSPQLHGNGKLWTGLWPNGLIEFGSGRPGNIGEDGVLGMKFPWWRGENVRGSLEITGRRLDGDAPPAFGDVPDGYGETGFQASMIFFPTQGCWEITGSVGDTDLTLVQYVRVIR